ncbi:MAG: hypothetical protein A07HB70_00067 [uncultured archaeon A07HB70]|nr:MAG: hypothetical protein A07HB70_00067 [uncultured archaeon A07HB70]
MADEFVKGLGILTGAGLMWMVLAGWYRTPSFGSTEQLVAPLTVDTANATLLNLVAITLMDVFFWLALLGPLTFWVLIPAGRQARKAVEERRS